MNSQLLKLLWDWAKAQLAEKLTAKAEKSPEAIALEKIRTVVEGFSSRYVELIPGREILDPLTAILRDTKAEPHDAPLKFRRPFTYPTLLTAYVRQHTTPDYQWPTLASAKDLWHLYPAIPNAKRLNRWEKAQTGDVVVFDGRVGNGHGAIGVVVEDLGNDVSANIDDIGHFVFRIYPKASVMGYFRFTNPEKTEK